MKKTLNLLAVLAILLSACTEFEPEKLVREPGMEGSRQIHLDFHTSEAIANVGADFDKKAFQDALIKGNVNSINIFGKGHHSWSYYPTEAGMVHPGLDFDLLGAMIEACHEIDVSAQVYFTIGWSANDALNHPEWAILDKNGTNSYLEMVKNLGPEDPFGWGWNLLSPEGEYLDLILAQTEEIVKNYDVDGMWYDIIPLGALNYNEASRKDMLERGIDINDEDAVRARHVEKMNEFLSRTNELVKKHRPDASIYYNWTTHAANKEVLELFKYEFYKYNTKHDLEDLPTSWGGYDIFPWRSKYFANTGKQIVAMSGKFHKSWGEFGGFKHKDAILYEAAAMVAFGANANFGDQLHPSGKLEPTTYENIGYAYNYVEQIEAYGIGGKNVASTGVYMTPDNIALEGCVKMLMEKQVNFNIVNTLDDWSDIEVLVITSGGVSVSDLPRISNFIAQGGKVLAMGEGIISEGKALIDIGADYLGKANFDVDYTLVGEQIAADIVRTPFLNYNPAIRVTPAEGTQVLAAVREPYFSRTLAHYCSHKNTPYTLENAAHPAVIRNGNVIYMAHDLDRQYYAEGARLHRDIFINALNLLREEPFVDAEMPSMGRINLLKQEDKDRYVLHLLYASPIQRGSVSVIEDLVPLYKIPISINVEETIKKAYMIPSGKKLKIRREDGKVKLVVPEFSCHTGIVLEY